LASAIGPSFDYTSGPSSVGSDFGDTPFFEVQHGNNEPILGFKFEQERGHDFTSQFTLFLRNLCERRSELPHRFALFEAEIGVTQFGSNPLRFDLIEADVNGNPGHPMFERGESGILVKSVEDPGENNLTQIFLAGSRGEM